MLSKLAVATVALLLAFQTAWAQSEAESIYHRHKGEVFQVRILDKSSGTKAAIGSGFKVLSGDYIVTNYHVVSELVRHPNRYRAEYYLENGSKGELRLITLDVVHDLALLQGDSLGGESLSLAQLAPVKGERLFSFGNPYDLGMTIVEGTFNGFLEKSLYEKIHFTGSINPGMSGGPSLNEAGQVVGVNVSTAGNQVSFLVPAKFVARLLEGATGQEPSAEGLQQSIRDQLLANQGTYMQTLLTAPFEIIDLGGYTVPGEINNYLSCWGDSSHDDDKLYQKSYQSCSTDDDIFLAQDQKTGSVSYRHEKFTTDTLNPLRFYKMLEQHFAFGHTDFRGEEKDFTDFVCTTDFVQHNSVDSKVVFCLRSYKDFSGLYDAYLQANSLNQKNAALYSTLTLKGVSEDNALQFMQKYLESITWNL